MSSRGFVMEGASVKSAADAPTLAEVEEAQRFCDTTVRRLTLTGPRHHLEAAKRYAIRLEDARRSARATR
jgi:hypothetical protein